MIIHISYDKIESVISKVLELTIPSRLLIKVIGQKFRDHTYLYILIDKKNLSLMETYYLITLTQDVKNAKTMIKNFQYFSNYLMKFIIDAAR